MTNKRGSNGIVADLAVEIPPIANCAMDGAPVLLWLVVENGRRQMRKQSGAPFCFGKLSLLALRESLRYLDAFFFFVVFFAAVFFADFFFDFFEVPAAAPGLTTAISFVPMGVPRPVQGSQPGPALKPTGVPV
jgi:hypothetical protein